MLRRALGALLLALVTVVVVATPAFASAPRHPGNDGGRISVAGGLFVGRDEVVDGLVISVDGAVQIDGVVTGDMYVARGDVRITGQARDDIFVIDGDVIVTGRVDGNIVVIGGRAIVQNEGARVRGDIRSTDQPRVAKGAQVNGSVEKLGVDGFFGRLMFALLAFLWLAVSISSAIVGLLFVVLFPRAAEATVRASRQVGSSIAFGVVAGIVGPAIALIAIASLIGLPFGLGLGGGLVALAGLGYVTSALCLGRSMIKPTTTGGRIGAFFAGFGILRAIAIIPGLGAIVGFIATVFGIGVLVNAAWRASRSSSPSDGTPASAPAPAEDSEPTTETYVPVIDVPATVVADTAADPEPAGDKTTSEAADDK